MRKQTVDKSFILHSCNRLTIPLLIILIVIAIFNIVNYNIHVSGDTNLAYQETYNYVTQWGSSGVSNGQFGIPLRVAIDSTGNVYVSDRQNHRIQKFNNDGMYITQWGKLGNGISDFGDLGPFGLCVDKSDNVYVADHDNHRILKFSNLGVPIAIIGNSTNLYDPYDVKVDNSGQIYIVDGSNRIQIFDSNGKYLKQYGSSGNGNGQLYNPTGIAIDNSGNIYVADTGHERIQKFDSNGQYITQWGSYGSLTGQFYYPKGITVDNAGNIFVVDVNNNRIQKFTSDGTFVTQWGTLGSDNGQFNSPNGLAIDDSGFAYVADSINNRIQKFSLTLVLMPTPTSTPITTPSPSGSAIPTVTPSMNPTVNPTSTTNPTEVHNTNAPTSITTQKPTITPTSETPSITLTPIENTYVDSYHPNKAYGNPLELWVNYYKFSNSDETTRCVSWLKFDLSSIPSGATISTARLELKSSIVYSPQQIYAYYSPDNSWSESTLTFSNMPSYIEQPLDSAYILTTSNQWYDWNVESAIQSSQTNSKTLTLVLAQPNIIEGGSMCMFDSAHPFGEGWSDSPKLIINWQTASPQPTASNPQGATQSPDLTTSLVIGSVSLLLILAFVGIGLRFYSNRKVGQNQDYSKKGPSPNNNFNQEKQSSNRTTSKESLSDPYSILGIQRTTTQNELRDAFRKLSMEWHPDKFAKHDDAKVQEMANEKYVKIKDAYEQILREKGW